MARIEEERPRQTEFRVEASGADILYQWLKLNQRAAESPFVNISQGSMLQLPLGDLEINDNLISKIHAHSGFADGDFTEFKIQAFFFPNSDPGSLLIGLFMQRYTQSPPAESEDLEMLAFELSKRLKTKGQDVIFRRRDEAIRVIPAESSTDTIFLLSQEQTPFGTAFCFSVQGNIDDDENELSRNYESYAGLLEDTIIAFYQGKNLAAPQKIFRLAPAKNTTSLLKQAKAKLARMEHMVDPLGELVETDEIREHFLLKERPEETFDDVGGAQEAIKELRLVAYGLKHPEAFREWGANLPRGVLLYGDPGTGKTLLAKATANQSEANIYIVRLSNILRSLYGKTEQLIAALFEDAKKNQPAIIFIDELEALATHREYSTEITRHLVSILQQSMDGFEKAGDRVVVIAATNAKDAIATALLRAGRFESVEIPKPDEAARERILEIHVNRARRKATRVNFDPSIDLRALAQATQGLTGADLAEIVDLALNQKVREQSEGLTPGPVTQGELVYQIQHYDRNKSRKPLGLVQDRGQRLN